MKGFRKKGRCRCLAWVLLFSLLLPMCPIESVVSPDSVWAAMQNLFHWYVGADAATVGKSSNDDADIEDDKREYDQESSGSQNIITPDNAVPNYTSYKGMSDWQNRKSFDAPENTYSLTVASGVNAGESVLYFLIEYEDVSGHPGFQTIFPTVDARERSRAFLDYYAKGGNVNDSFGKNLAGGLNYKESDSSEKALDAWTVQDFIFQTDTEISKVEKVELYLSTGKWSVQGASVYKVKRYKGYEEYGLISGQTFLDFEGDMIADFKKKSSGTITLKPVSGMPDSVIGMAAADGSSSYFTIEQYKEGQNKKKYATEDALYTIRMDFADQKGAGIDAFINEKKTLLKEDNGIVEDITAEIQYVDKHGWNRKVTLPVILSSFATARLQAQNSALLSFAGRGDTIAFPGWYPELDSVSADISLYVGDAARKRLNDVGLSVKSATSEMTKSLNALSSDDIALSGMSFYKGGCMAYVPGGTDSSGKKLEGANLAWTFGNTGPTLYYTTSESGGRLIKAGGSDKIKLSAYKSGAPVVAATESEASKFLVTLQTDNLKTAATADDVTIRLHYTTTSGVRGQTSVYKVRDKAEDFLGPWPKRDGSDYIYANGMKAGGSISFLIEVPNLKEFTRADISLLGEDEWQMTNLIISYVESYDARRAYLAGSEAEDSDYIVTRNMVSADIFTLSGSSSTVYDSDGTRISSSGESLDEDEVEAESDHGFVQLFTAGQTLSIFFTTQDVDDVSVLDYSSVRYSLTLEQAKQDWGLAKKRKTYDVSVVVASDDSTDNGNGDAGSSNHFYFQLIFKNGKSGYVLANQQISSDAFRSGQTEVFTIATNRNYGELTGVRIIPEESSSDSEPFDKLNIDSISVAEQTQGGAYMLYVVDQVGWIDIDYHDEMESAFGQEASMESQIATTYKVTHRERSVNLLCEFTTLPWTSDYKQFQGSVVAEVVYEDTNGVVHENDPVSFDVVSRIASYMGKTAKTIENPTNPDSIAQYADSMKTISDPSWMFRPNHTDRFTLPPLPDFKSIKSIRFVGMTRNGYPATWNLGSITVSQIQEAGSIQLSNNEEYIRDAKLQRLAVSTNEEVVSTQMDIGVPADTGKIGFTDNEIVWSSDEWVTPVSRIPDNEEDTVNIYLYPDASIKNIVGIDVKVAMAYSTSYSTYRQLSVSNLKTSGSGTENAVYYAKGISAADFTGAREMAVQCTNSRMYFDHAIVQHMRENVVVATYEYEFLGSSAILGLSASPRGQNVYTDDTEETVAVSFEAGTDTQALFSVERDVAVAFYYKSSLDTSNTEYCSPYVYLTDQGYSTIEEGLFAELSYKVPYVREITGYSIVAYGGLTGNIDAAAAVCYEVTDTTQDAETGRVTTSGRTKRCYASFGKSLSLTSHETKYKRTSEKQYGEDSVTPVSLTFRTAEASEKGKSGTDAKVQMIFHYRTDKDTEETKIFADITPYIQETADSQATAENQGTVNSRKHVKKFETGKEATVKFFLPEMNKNLSLLSVDILPYNSTEVTVEPESEETEEQSITEGTDWTISGVTGDLGFGEKTIERTVSQTFQGLKGGGSLRLINISMVTYVNKNNGATETVDDQMYQIVAKPKDKIKGSVLLEETTAGISVKAYSMIGNAGEDVTGEVITSSKLDFTFTAPENQTGDVVIYKIEVSPVDAPDIMDVIYVTVKSDPVETEAPRAPEMPTETPEATQKVEETEEPEESEVPVETETPEG